MSKMIPTFHKTELLYRVNILFTTCIVVVLEQIFKFFEF